MKATAQSISIGGKGAKAFAIGAAIARNTIGTDDAANEVKARIINSTVIADGDISLTAKADNYIDATVSASSVAVGVSAKGAPTLSIGGVFAENFVATDVEAVIDGFNPLAPNAPLKQIRAKGATGVSLLASDASRIWADAKAVSVAASLAGSGIAGDISVAFNVALNEIDNDVTANINKVDVDADNGDVVVRAETLEDNNDFTADYQVGTSGNVALKTGDRIENTDGKVYRFLGYEYNYTTSSTSPVIAPDGVLKDEVVVLADGNAYKAVDDLTDSVDLGEEEFQ